MTQPIRILFADDSDDMLSLLKFAAERRGWEGDYVSSASGIIEAVNRNCGEGQPCYNAIVADVNYFSEQPGPRMTGITAAREVRDVHPNVPIVFITGFSNSLIREEVRRIGGAELFEKPVEIEELLDRVQELIKWIPCAYEGEERRQTSLNRSGQYRRATDKHIQAPETIRKVIEEEREKGVGT
jgi:FOG: CheY-like receiver